jgi:hypothetical protein
MLYLTALPGFAVLLEGLRTVAGVIAEHFTLDLGNADLAVLLAVHLKSVRVTERSVHVLGQEDSVGIAVHLHGVRLLGIQRLSTNRSQLYGVCGVGCRIKTNNNNNNRTNKKQK